MATFVTDDDGPFTHIVKSLKDIQTSLHHGAVPASGHREGLEENDANGNSLTTPKTISFFNSFNCTCSLPFNDSSPLLR